MLLSVYLSNGGIVLAKKKVNVKRLDVVQNFGAIDIPLPDKTDRLTMDAKPLERH